MSLQVMETTKRLILSWIGIGLILLCITPNTTAQEFYEQQEEQLTEVRCVFLRDAAATQSCDCGYSSQNMVLPQLGGSVFQVIVTNCKSMAIRKDTFSALNLLTGVTFSNIEDLLLEEGALHFSRRRNSNAVDVQFNSVAVQSIDSHAISGNVRSVVFDNCNIGFFGAFAIASILESIDLLSITGSKVDRIEPQAFKKFTSRRLQIRNTTFISDIPSRAFFELEVTERLDIWGSSFTSVASSAFMFEDVESFTLSNNIFNKLAGDSFRMKIRERVSIQNNEFYTTNNAAFHLIEMEREYWSRHSTPLQFNFNANQMSLINGPNPLIFSQDFDLRIGNLEFPQLLACSEIQALSQEPFFANNDVSIYIRHPDYDEFHTFQYVLRDKCSDTSIVLFVALGVTGLILLIIIAVVVIVICLRRKRRRKLDIVMPEAKTYRETHIIMQIENAGLLKTDL